MRSISSRQNPIVAAIPRARGLRRSDRRPCAARRRAPGRATRTSRATPSSSLRSHRRGWRRTTEEGRVAQMLERSGVEVVAGADAVFAAMSPVRTPSGLVAIATRRPASRRRCLLGVERARARRDRRAGPGQRRRARSRGRSWRHDRRVRDAARRPIRSHGRRCAAAWAAHCGCRSSAACPLPRCMTCLKTRRHPRPSRRCRAAAHDPDAVDWRGTVALIVGGEGAGLSDEVSSQLRRAGHDSDGGARGVAERRGGGRDARLRGTTAARRRRRL